MLLDHAHRIALVVTLMISGGLLRLVFALCYSDRERILAIVKLVPGSNPESYYGPFDPLTAPLPFLWVWFDIVSIIAISAMLDHWAVWTLTAVLVAGRMRALQEIGHNAVHCALCRSKTWQWFLSDFFSSFPYSSGTSAHASRLM
jgi:hypothetical protein